ncbi:MAG TPA: hypothetical protein VFI72_04655, partial [Candidatus Angelobacter sp.]|nr:hypothetical protein [Candidatus Angelobacter sp.]
MHAGAFEIERRIDSVSPQPVCPLAADTPDNAHLNFIQHRVPVTLKRLKTPPVSGSFFARRFAIFASVFVGPIPIDTGIPVQRFTPAL